MGGLIETIEMEKAQDKEKSKEKEDEKEDEKEATQAVSMDVVKEGANELTRDAEKAENVVEDLSKTEVKSNTIIEGRNNAEQALSVEGTIAKMEVDV